MRRRFFILTTVLVTLAIAPAEASTKPDDIVDLRQVDPTILVDMMYATNANFLGRKVRGYNANICYLTKAAALGLAKAQSRLKAIGKKSHRNYTLLVRDCYRPQKSVLDFVTWSKDEDDVRMKTTFYPSLAKSELIKQNYISPVSGHSRASSVDLTIAERNEFGEIEILPMGTVVDFFGERAHTEASTTTRLEKDSRQLLRDVLSPEFKNYAKEWWHFALKVEPYPKSFFDFDIDVPDHQKQYASSENEITTQFSEAPILAELDRNSDSPLALSHLLKSIHVERALKVPSYDLSARADAATLNAFSDTFGKIAKVVTADLTRLIDELGIDWEKDITKTYDPKSAKTESGKKLRGNGNVTRFFNEKWLTSKTGQFLLSGISNRIDRREFSPGTCGEVRFLYRLGYETRMAGETYASRVPFTINVVYTYNDDHQGCRSVATAWNLQTIKNEIPVIVAQRLMTGPLDPARLTFKQIEINVQAARFPSDLENVEGRKFAGQAIYLMRIFGFESGVFVPRKLENTPDVQAIRENPKLQKRLQEFLMKNLAAVDNGTYLLPDSLLADLAISYSTLGSSRLANKPFDLLLTTEAASKIIAASDPTQFKFIGDGAGLLERLNTSTCMGCHQASSTAGFHFLGVDRFDFGSNPTAIKTALDGNRLVLPFSPHLFNDLPRRARYVAALANGEAPNTFRPHPSAPIDMAGDNMPCPLPNDRSLARDAAWSCDTSHGATCTALVTNAKPSVSLGQCVPPSSQIYGGLSCRTSRIEDSTSAQDAKPLMAFNALSFRDRVATDDQIYKLAEGKLDARSYNCRPTKIGVPLGRVTKQCTTEQTSLKDFKLDPVPNDFCAVVGGKGFEEMAKGYFSSRKFAAGVGRGNLNTCSPTRFCREDYICQEMPDFLSGARFKVPAAILQSFREKRVGFCTPTYFVYQLRLDGHPNPN
jgi:D-alanyl-D-alanine dipeptidase